MNQSIADPASAFRRRLASFGSQFTPNAQQLLNTTVFLLFARFLIKLDFTWKELFLAFAVAFATELVGSYLRGYKRSIVSYVTPFITAIAITLILRTTSLWILAFVVFLGIAQKFILQIDKKAFQNPSNFAVLAAFVLFPGSSYLELAEWGHIWWVNAVIFALGFVLLFRVRLLGNTLFFIALVILGHLLYISTSPVFIWHRITSTTFLLYTLFIINDPKAIPSTRRFQLINVVVIFSIYFFSMLYWTEREILLPISVFASSMLVPLYRRVEDRIGRLEGDAQAKAFRPWARGTAALFLAAGASLYFSDRNLRRTLGEDLAATALAKTKEQAGQNPDHIRIVSKKEFLELFNNQRSELYQREWTDSHLEVHPYPEARQDPKKPELLSVSNGVSRFGPAFSAEFSGFDLAPYASIASGDINHDGLLDLVLAWPYGRLRVFLNTGKNSFIEVSRHLFTTVPSDLEQAALADLNSDSHLDLVLVRSGYRKKGGTEVYLFDPKRKMFFEKKFYKTKALSSGGLSFVDLNRDRILDFYVSYGVNWQSPRPDFKNSASYIDEFFLSDPQGARRVPQWKESLEASFPAALSKSAFISMTPLFSDLDKDGDPDFLLGADFRDPSIILLRKNGKYVLLTNEHIEKNTRHSMSYFPLDVDNDGSLELWENGISITEKSSLSEVEQMTETSRHIPQSEYHKEMTEIIRKFSKGGSNCKEYRHPWALEECKELYYTIKALTQNKREYCNKIVNPARRYSCLQDLLQMTESDENIFKTKRFDPEIHVKQTEVNVLLKYSKARKKYIDVIGSNLQYTGWTWASFPFDINNDGYLDFYITNGYFSSSHNTNRLFLHSGKAGSFEYKNRAPDLRVDFEDEGRGLIIQDLDLDGDGEIVINNAATSPIYLENRFGGKSLQVELRSKSDNYFGLGAVLELHTDKGILTRELTLGGIWNSYPALRAHFGIPEGATTFTLRILWPDGVRQEYADLKPGNLYVVYK